VAAFELYGPRWGNVHPYPDGPLEAALIGTPIADISDLVEVGHVARSFNSCLVCTVHDGKIGEELARFRTA
jgi:hydrogenase large subunit